MSRFSAKRLFDESRPVYARGVMELYDQTVQPSERVPWQELGIPLRMVQSWYRLRMVSHNPDGDGKYERDLSNDLVPGAVTAEASAETVEASAEADENPDTNVAPVSTGRRKRS